jgi:hypothetical protein
MRRKLAAAASVIIIATVVASVLFVTYNMPSNSVADRVYVGVTYGGETVDGGKQLIDKVKGYTNLFVLQSGTLERDFDSVNVLGDYAISAGMYFLPYFGNFVMESFFNWLDAAKERWGTRLVGVYYADEPAGKMLDSNVEFQKTDAGDVVSKTKYGDIAVQKLNGVVVHYELGGRINLYQPEDAGTGRAAIYATFYSNGTITPSEQVTNLVGSPTYVKLNASRPFQTYDEAAETFYARDQGNIAFVHNSTRVFTSDYVLSWFDSMAGYDVILSQIGWNLTLPQQIAITRGAANLQSKDWGVVITWKYDAPPYLDSGSEILSQMRISYECGAKYILLFDYYGGNGNPYGTLQDEHFQALQSFWNDVVRNPSVVQGSVTADTVLVLPKNYGWGMRWRDDKIWGVFQADAETWRLWDLAQGVLVTGDFKADIVYEDANFPLPATYQHVFRWNDTA